jgi:hypothetical protein
MCQCADAATRLFRFEFDFGDGGHKTYVTTTATFFPENTSHQMKVLNQSTLTKWIFLKLNITAMYETGRTYFQRKRAITLYHFVWCEGNANTLF